MSVGGATGAGFQPGKAGTQAGDPEVWRAESASFSGKMVTSFSNLCSVS